ncbi:MAG TPA: DUF378 domain-containing protein [Candidatus Paceibacterota bacterium]
MRTLNGLDWVALILTIVGGINWGLVGAFNFNLVDTVLGAGSAIAMIVYILVGLSAIVLISTAAKLSKA